MTAFIIDEGHIGDSIEIYSSNNKLLKDIVEIASSLEYLCMGPRIKSKNHIYDFRAYISTKSARKFAKDIKEVSKDFPTCDLAHKQPLLDQIVERQNKVFQATKKGVTKIKILELLSGENLTVQKLCKQFKLAPSSMREHLRELEKKGLVNRIITKGEHAHLWKKVTNSFLV